jgi:hypothetical protein
MCVVKAIGLILLAVYLILTGGISIFEATPAPAVRYGLDLAAILSGVLLLISIGSCSTHKE